MFWLKIIGEKMISPFKVPEIVKVNEITNLNIIINVLPDWLDGLPLSELKIFHAR